MTRKSQQGMTLIEVMVALVVMGAGLLTAVGLQWRALQGSESAMKASQAAWLAQSVLERSRSPGGVDRVQLQRMVEAFAGRTGVGRFESGVVSIGWNDARGHGWRELQLDSKR